DMLQEGQAPGAREAVAQWFASDKGMKAYCSETGQSYWAMRRWRLKYAEELQIPIKRRPGARKANRQKTSTSTTPTPAIVPIRIAPAAAVVSLIEVKLRGARAIIVQPDIDAALLARLIVV